MSLKDRIMQEEGLELKPYKDEFGNWTIYYGHLCKPGETYANTAEDALYYLEKDIDVATQAARRLFAGFDDLSQARQDVLTDMAFNLGETRLSYFSKLRHAVAIKDYEGAAQEMKDSLWYHQVPRRAQALIDEWLVG